MKWVAGAVFGLILVLISEFVLKGMGYKALSYCAFAMAVVAAVLAAIQIAGHRKRETSVLVVATVFLIALGIAMYSGAFEQMMYRLIPPPAR